MGCCSSKMVKREFTTSGKAYADGVDVDAAAKYLRDPRNWITQVAGQGSGAKDFTCALQGPGTDEVLFTFQRQDTFNQKRLVYHTTSGTAEVKRVDVQGDRAVVEVLVKVGASISFYMGSVVSVYTYTLQRASDTFSSQSGTHMELTVATTYEVPSYAREHVQSQAIKAYKQQIDALMIHAATELTSPVKSGEEKSQN